MAAKISKYFILTALFFFLIGCIEGVMFPTKFQFKAFYTTLFHVPSDQIKPFFSYFVTKIHTHVNLIGWLSSAVMGVLYFIVPQISGVERYNRWLAYGNWGGHTLGLLLVIAGFHLIGIFGLSSGFTAGSPEFRSVAAPYRMLVSAGGILITISAVLFICNMLMSLLGEPHSPLSGERKEHIENMKTSGWFSLLSKAQRAWFYGTLAVMLAIIAFGMLMDASGGKKKPLSPFSVGMSIKQIAPSLKVTGKALARELGLPLNVPKNKKLAGLNVQPETLDQAVHHLLSHRGSTLKYYVYAALVLGGLVFLARLGRPDFSDIKQRKSWYPRTPYIVSLLVSVVVAGFLLGKSPNPMEGVVKVFKSMVGLYPDPAAKVMAFVFFMALAIAGNKLVCGWACPFGAFQELIYSIPVLKRIKQKKLAFALTNTIRVLVFIVMLMLLFGVIGRRRGFVIYHYINPFNLFNMDIESISVALAILFSLLGSFLFYRPFCQFICPFGLVSWMAERLSIFRVRIHKDRCTQCGACIQACPLGAAKGRVQDTILPADCFSCGRCLNVCPFDAIQYGPVFKKLQ
ncbi:4Fe-4S binding protein [Desulfobacter curvatus]|uniref:4Fe-4S binding protein n=1 Tax=Desulfobacter curvatus TaxID=2290 RepID=UPI0003793539|nr:4Fe-4S binding protein [Desulfobacter curvatus]